MHNRYLFLMVLTLLVACQPAAPAPDQLFEPVPDWAICDDQCGNGVCQEIVCAGQGCPCVESVTSCPADCAADPADPALPEGWTAYANADLGFAFAYPEAYGTVAVAIVDPSTSSGIASGRSFRLTFSRRPQLVFSGASVGYATADRAPSFADGWVYGSTGEAIRIRPAAQPDQLDGTAIAPLTTLTSEHGVEVLLVDRSSWPEEPAALSAPASGSLAALVNLQGFDFKGLVIADTNLRIVPRAEFEQVLRTIRHHILVD